MPANEWRVSREYRGQIATHRARALSQLAASQHGAVHRRQLIDLGLSADAVNRLIVLARLVPLHRGVYAVGHACLRPEGYRLAAVLACGDGAVLSHRSSAAHHGLLQDERARADVTVPLGSASGRSLPKIIVHRARLAENDVTIVDGVPCTSVARTLVDVAGAGPRRHVARALDQALVLRLYDQRAVDEILRRPGRLRGAAVLRSILEERHPDAHLARSELEARALERLSGAGVPQPMVNAWLADLGVEVDLLWEGERLVVELDGRRYHAHRRRADAERDARLTAIGYQVRRFGWGDVTSGPFPDDIRAELGDGRVAT
jgi:predicted transcriptional regulator of viral defense system